MTSTAEVTTSKDAKTLTSQHILEVVTNDSLEANILMVYDVVAEPTICHPAPLPVG
jgi:hypothetical protein